MEKEKIQSARRVGIDIATCAAVQIACDEAAKRLKRCQNEKQEAALENPTALVCHHAQKPELTVSSCQPERRPGEEEAMSKRGADTSV